MSKEKETQTQSLAKSSPKWASLSTKLKKIPNHPIFKKTLIVVGAVLILLATAVFIFNLSYSQRIFPKTYIGGIDLGGQTIEEAQKTLGKAMDENPNQEITLSYQDQSWSIQAADVALSYDAKKSVDLAWAVGRQGHIEKIIKEQFYSAISSNHYLAVFTFNQEKITNFLTEIGTKINAPEQNAHIIIDNLVPSVAPEKIGQRLNLEQNTQIILGLFGLIASASSQDLAVDQIQPKVTQAMAQKALGETNKVLENNLKLTTDKQDFQLDPQDFAPWLDFVVNEPKGVLGSFESQSLELKVNQEKLKTYVADLSAKINQAPRDAKFSMQEGRAVAFQTSQTGYELNQEEAVKLLNKAILQAKSTVELPVKITEPDVSSSPASTYGIKELVAEGTTSWRGSPKNRIHNLTLGSKNISGTIVKPGEEFSTIKAIGPIDTEHGFLSELVIKNGTEVVPDVGGGLCQVSTTLFRAALNTGLEITARTNHSFRVSYYEPPVGMDATIYDPLPDFKFINDMKTPILIWAVPTDNGLSFQIYGTKDGRQVEVSSPVTFNYIDPPEPVYKELSTMEPGTIRQTERATRGVTATFHYKVTDKAGKVLQNQTFVSKYIPVPDMFLYGPGADVPKPAEPSE